MISPTRDFREEVYQRIRSALDAHQPMSFEDLYLLLACTAHAEECLAIVQAMLNAEIEKRMSLENAWHDHLQRCFATLLAPKVQYRCGACRGRGLLYDDDDFEPCGVCHGTGVIE